jgi:UMF1 family MFS transporter
MFKSFNKTEKAWIFYDIANSAFILTVVTVLFPLYHLHIAGAAGMDPMGEAAASTNFKFITAGLALLVALLSPLIATLADYKGNKQKIFKIFLVVGLVGSLLMAVPWNILLPFIGIQSYFVHWLVLVVLFFFTVGGYNLTIVVYDAFLVDATNEERYDEVSAAGYAWGYIGSLIPFFIAIIPFVLYTFGILSEQYYTYSMSFAFVVVFAWWYYFTLPLIKNVHQTYYIEHEEKAISQSLKRLFSVFKDIKKYKNIFLFLIAYLLYIDVVNSVIRLATTIGSDLDVSDTSLLGIVIMVQVVAFPFAIIFGKLTKRFGGKTMIFVGIILYFIAIILASQIINYGPIFMWYTGLIVGFAQGGIQSVSRSYFAVMLPKEKTNEFFGFFSVFGRFAGIFSPFILAVLQNVYMDQGLSRAAAVSKSLPYLLIPLGISVVIMLFVKNQKTNGTTSVKSV